MVGGDVVVVMARYPTPGAVKTRLAAAVGPERACTLYRAFLRDVAARLGGGPWQLVWAVTPPDADLAAILGAPCRQIAQRGETLGERMAACFATVLGAGAERMIMLGADAPHIGADVVAAALAALADHDAVFVPTRDGGYCLVGLREAHDIFTAVTMGRDDVFARSGAVLAARGLRWRALAPSFDVDELDDAVDLAALIAAGAVTLPHTRAVLDGWRQAGLLPAPPAP